jgi:hypothetical protein
MNITRYIRKIRLNAVSADLKINVYGTLISSTALAETSYIPYVM